MECIVLCGMCVQVQMIVEYVLVVFDVDCVVCVWQVMVVVGYLYLEMCSGVGYDVVNLLYVVLFVMVFVLCKVGFSYNEVEDVDLVYFV